MTESTDPTFEAAHTQDGQAPEYQQPTEHDTKYQPEPQGDGGHYQPHAHRDRAEAQTQGVEVEEGQ